MYEATPLDIADSNSTFANTLPEAALEALRAVIDAPFDEWHDHAMHREGDDLAVLLRFHGEHKVELEIGTPVPGARAFFSGEHITLSYRSPKDSPGPMSIPESRALIERVKARVQAADEAGEPVAALRRALVEWRRFAQIGDWMYRQLGSREALLRLGFRCNQDCWFCWQNREWPEPPPEYYFKWLDEFAAAGQTAVSISGGEPTLHKSLPALIAKARELGMSAKIQTNAIQLAKPAILKRLLDAGLTNVFVSYHSPFAETSNRMTRAPGTHARTQAGIAAALEAGLEVQLNCVVERENYQELEAHAQDVLTRFVEPYPDNPVSLVAYSHPCEYYDEDVFAEKVVSLTDIQPHVLGALRLLHNAGIEVEGIGTCGFPPCLLVDEPALLRWLVPDEQHAMDTAGRIYAEACDRCAVKDRCLGLRKEYVHCVGDAGVRPFERAP